MVGNEHRGKLATVMIVGVLFAFTAVALAGTAVDDAAVNAAMQYAQKHKQELGVTGSDVNELSVSSVSASKQSGVTFVYLQQNYRGIEVWNAMLTVSVHPNGSVTSSGSRFFANLAAEAGGQLAKKNAVEATAAAAKHLNLKPSKGFQTLNSKGGPSQAAVLSDGGIARSPIETKLVWLPVDGKVKLAWNVEIEETSGEHYWSAFVDAQTGESLGKIDLVTHDAAESIAAGIMRLDGGAMVVEPALAGLASFAETDGATYRVIQMPFGSPSETDRTLVSNAANPSASPFGWHDTNGAKGAEYTVSRGNNVWAYADRDNNNVPDPGTDPDGGASLAFDFPLDLTRRPFDSQAAMVTNLFYWNNLMHDVTSNYGFDEVSGNFQQTNYSGVTGGNDYVRAEAQDGSGRNNANFSTPRQNAADPRPRMQMFEWRSALPNPITVAAPSTIAGTYYGPMAGFGESLVTTGPITGPVVYVNDGAGVAPNDGCEPFTVPAGAIPMMDRGNCNFTVKVKNAQLAGAAVALVVNNIAGPATAMGGTDPTVAIPSVMISMEDGAKFKGALPLTATIADGTGGAPDRDSDIDSGVIAHEYGHGISNRLTGGANNTSCLGNAEQMGEGWSDFFALMMTSQSTDSPSMLRGIGTYVNFEPNTGAGIRPTPYSRDMMINPSTYAAVADVVNISQPHGIGYVWNTMLWEVYWNLVDRHGFNPNIYADWTTGGNNLMIQLVIDGMKIQPCSPGFVDGRNAILAADEALTGGTNKCEIWRGFAKRGLGFSASQGNSNNRLDGVEAFDLPAACSAATFGAFQPPVEAAPSTNYSNAGSVIPVKFALQGEFSQIDSQPVNCSTLEPTGEVPTAVQFPGATGVMQSGTDYHFNWQTDASWANSCRRLTLRIPAGTDAFAYFRFE